MKKHLITTILLATFCLISYSQSSPNYVEGPVSTANEVFLKNDKYVVLLKELDANGNIKDKGSGSGVFVSEDGLVVTNHHVIWNNKDQEYRQFAIIKNTDTIYDYEIVAKNAQVDLAILKTDFTMNSTVDLAGNYEVTPGEVIYTLGYPKEQYLFSDGIIAAYTPKISSKVRVRLIHHTGIFAGGASGGALFNENGELLGITKSQYQYVEPTAKKDMYKLNLINKSIPIEEVKKLLAEIEEE